MRARKDCFPCFLRLSLAVQVSRVILPARVQGAPKIKLLGFDVIPPSDPDPFHSQTTNDWIAVNARSNKTLRTSVIYCTFDIDSTRLGLYRFCTFPYKFLHVTRYTYIDTKETRTIVPIDPENLQPPTEMETWLADVGTAERENIRERLIRYVGRLLETNQLFNLTSDRSPEKQWLAHVGDALSAAREAIR